MLPQLTDPPDRSGKRHWACALHRRHKGTRFFYSTLVQTLFYGVFSAWVLWARQVRLPRGVRSTGMKQSGICARPSWPPYSNRFLSPAGCNRWAWSKSWTGPLRPSTAWTARALLCPASTRATPCPISTSPSSKPLTPPSVSSLGVWYTPAEVVRYMVARVDKALKDDLGYC